MKRAILHNKTAYMITGCTAAIVFLIVVTCFIHIKQAHELLFLQTMDRVQEISNISVLQAVDKVCKLKASLFSVTIEKNDNSVMGENQKIIAEIYYEQPVVAGKSDAVNRINEYFETEAEGWINGEVSRLTLYGYRWWNLFHHQLNDMREMYGDDVLAIQPCRYTVKTEFMYQNEQYICFKHEVKYQTGGPSCDYCFGTTFNKNTGEIVPINEIVEIDGETLKAMLVASYEEEEFDKKRRDDYERLIERLYGNSTSNDFIIRDGKDEIQLNYEYYYDGELFHIILNRELNYNGWWEVEWDGKTGSEMELFFPQSEQAKALTQEDFSVSDGVDTIVLGMPWRDLIMHRELMVDEPANPMNHFVGNIYEGDNIYYVYRHIYDGITIFYSDKNNDENDRTYIVYQITIEDNSFSTARGIRIGDGKEEVIEAYGIGDVSIENNCIRYSYYYEDLAIRFIFDKKNSVKEIRYVMDHSYS